MLNNPTTNQERGKSQLYDVNNLYIITTYRKVRADFETTRYITEYFAGIKDAEHYHEFFSNVGLNMLEGEEPLEFDKPFISKVVPLKQFVNTSIIEKQDIFYLVVNLNAMERCALDVID